MKRSLNSRRTFIAGMIATLGYGFYAKAASAFPAGTRGAVQAASSILRMFGIDVDAEFDQTIQRDVLRFTIEPLQGIQYEQIVWNGIAPCWLVKSFRDAVVFTNYNMSTGQPDLYVSSQEGVSEIEILDPNAHIQITIAGGAVYELRNGELVRVS